MKLFFGLKVVLHSLQLLFQVYLRTNQQLQFRLNVFPQCLGDFDDVDLLLAQACQDSFHAALVSPVVLLSYAGKELLYSLPVTWSS